MFYVVTPPAETEWRVPREELAAMLRRAWPDVEVWLTEAGAPDARDVVWRIRLGATELEGSQDRAGQAQYLDGPPEAVARFAAWWRRQVPEEQALILCDESYATVVTLEPRISEDQLIASLCS